jgi:hypothetical protein
LVSIDFGESGCDWWGRLGWLIKRHGLAADRLQGFSFAALELLR